MILKIQNRISVYEPDVGIKFVIKILQKFHMGELFIYSKRIVLDAWSFKKTAIPRIWEQSKKVYVAEQSCGCFLG